MTTFQRVRVIVSISLLPGDRRGQLASGRPAFAVAP